jgi:two-component system, cell cycle response regulator DivK
MNADEKTAVKRKVLLVEDYGDAREMYTQCLEMSGFEVVEASNGVEALQRAFETNPDIVVMDLSLPLMDGSEATRRLKADRRTARVPVIALTGYSVAGVLDAARQAGCDACLTKPCLPDDLVTEVLTALERAAASDPIG